MDFTPYLSVGVMLLGIFVGALISPRIQHKVGVEYGRKDLIFQRKLKYFENITETIEKNKKIYSNMIQKIENSKTNIPANSVLEALKKERAKFNIMASPLYIDNNIFSEKINEFVAVEKNIFNMIPSIKDYDKAGREKMLKDMKKDLEELKKIGDEILHEMKKELESNND
ncbi:MAG TPA: hypothetical protein VMC07_00060 [Candidatus Omnitrophota bacterium]|nr:hypothetical protein [Candidatus Omnitrophota bacterium]